MGEMKPQPLRTTYNLDVIYKMLVEDNYYTQNGEVKISPLEILRELRSNPEIMNYVRSIPLTEGDNWFDDE